MELSAPSEFNIQGHSDRQESPHPQNYGSGWSQSMDNGMSDMAAVNSDKSIVARNVIGPFGWSRGSKRFEDLVSSSYPIHFNKLRMEMDLEW
jgi:hypothetical protein